MRPYTVHTVITTDSCIAVGGHFFSNFCYDLSFKGLIAEHFLGGAITNASHVQSAVLLFRVIIRIHRCIYWRSYQHRPLWDYWPEMDEGMMPCIVSLTQLIFLFLFLGRLPHPAQLSYLILMVLNIPKIQSEMLENPDGCEWHQTTSFKSDFSRIEKLCKELVAIIVRDSRIRQEMRKAQSDILSFIEPFNESPHCKDRKFSLVSIVH